MLSFAQENYRQNGGGWSHYITERLEKQLNPLLLLLAVPLPPKSLEAVGPLIEERTVDTAYGPVGPLARRGQRKGPSYWVQPYYGLPSRTDPRATIMAARALHIDRIVAWEGAVAVNPMLGPGYPMLITDFIDFTRQQPQAFLEEEEGAGDFSQAPAVCPLLTEALSQVLPMAPGGVYLGVDGPRRETAAEARMFRSWGADVLGQNLVPEIALAREMDLCFAGLVTVDAISAERPSPPAQVEDHRELEAVVQALTALLHSDEVSGPCSCGRS